MRSIQSCVPRSNPAPSEPMRQRTTLTVLTGLLTLLVAACGPSASTTSPSPPDGLREIQVELTDGLRIVPELFQVQAGETVRFVVTNAGVVDHEFYIGDEIAQGAHEKAMASTGGRLVDSAEGVGIEPRTRESLVYTFAGAGSLIVGCHVPGHFGGGMKATIAIAP